LVVLRSNLEIVVILDLREQVSALAGYSDELDITMPCEVWKVRSNCPTSCPDDPHPDLAHRVLPRLIVSVSFPAT
jgi:hypothetical protein